MIKIAICDDDNTDAETLTRLIKEYDADHNLEILLRIFESGEKFLESGFVADILLLDIFMGENDGIQVGFVVKERYAETLIIYTTNLREKMGVAFNRLHSFGYLVKPVSAEELYPILSDAVKEIKSRQSSGKDTVTFLSENSTLIQLSATDIYYFEYCDRRVKIVTKDNTYVCKDKIGSIAEKMEQYGFAMSHQSFVVNLYHIYLLKDQFVIMENGDSVFLAQKRASSIRKKLMQAARESG
ncbi:MAG: response regulator transcription factor [Lachnospiraceae bacterium]|nr:response regulator transcription factor [Lachnospiraceae bacterium]